MTIPPERVYIVGQERQELAAAMAADYAAGHSIRSVGRKFGHTYAFTRKLIREAGGTLRGRGGPR